MIKHKKYYSSHYFFYKVHMENIHTADNLYSIDRWGIRNKIVGVVSDNAANIKKAVSDCGWIRIPYSKLSCQSGYWKKCRFHANFRKCKLLEFNSFSFAFDIVAFYLICSEQLNLKENRRKPRLLIIFKKSIQNIYNYRHLMALVLIFFPIQIYQNIAIDISDFR